MRRSCCLAAFLVLAAVPAARAQLPPTYMISNEPPYRDQGGYGTCWTFATMASIETNIIQEGLPGYDAAAGLSECDLAWNSGFLSQIGGGLTGINNGGNYLMAAAYLARGGGPLTDAQAPYSDSELRGASRRTDGPLLCPRHRVVPHRRRHQDRRSSTTAPSPPAGESFSATEQIDVEHDVE